VVPTVTVTPRSRGYLVSGVSSAPVVLNNIGKKRTGRSKAKHYDILSSDFNKKMKSDNEKFFRLQKDKNKLAIVTFLGESLYDSLPKDVIRAAFFDPTVCDET